MRESLVEKRLAIERSLRDGIIHGRVDERVAKSIEQ